MSSENIYVLMERVRELFEYDRAAGKLFWKISNSNIIKVGQEAGCIRDDSYRVVRIDGKLHYAHRLIFLIENGYLPDFIDHRDGNPLNNHISNLRECSNQENQRNKTKQSNNTSGVPGVCWHKARNKWVARCADRTGKQTHLGLFTDIQEAAEVVKKFRLEHHGQFAIDHREAA